MWRKWPAEQAVFGNAGTLRIDTREACARGAVGSWWRMALLKGLGSSVLTASCHGAGLLHSLLLQCNSRLLSPERGRERSQH